MKTAVPTLENVADYFSEEFYHIIHDTGGVLTTLEASETPTRSYIVNLEEKDDMMQLTKEADDKMLSDVMDAVLDGIINE